MAEDLEIKFSHDGGSSAYMGAGWSPPEGIGAWMTGAQSTLVLARPEQPGDYLLTLELQSLLAPGRHDFQRLSVRVNGAVVCNQVLHGDAVVQCWVPWSVLGGPAESTLVLAHPDGWAPAELSGGEGDQRVMSFHALALRLSLLTERASQADPAERDAAERDAAEREEGAGRAAVLAPPRDGDGLAMHRLVLDFESLGPGCALGLVQRHYGAEPLGLFRFAATPTGGLLAALEGDFHAASLDGRAALALDAQTREYALVDRVHGFAWHTGRHDGQAEAGALERQELARLPYLVRRFYETLAGGGKILVLCDEDAPADPALVERLLAALRRHGDATLLWVGAAADGRAPGEVEWLGDGLMRGWVDRLATGREAVASMAAWGAVCREAHRMWRAGRAT